MLGTDESTYSFLHWLVTLWKHCFVKVSVFIFQSATPSRPWNFKVRGQQDNFLKS